MRAPKYWNTLFATKVINAVESGNLSEYNIAEWETEQNEGVPPRPSLGAKEIMLYYEKLKKSGIKDRVVRSAETSRVQS